MASSADFAGMAFPAVAEVVSPVDLAGMAFPAVVVVISPAELAEMTFPAVAGVASLAVVEVVSSTDSMEPAGSPNVCDSQSDCGSLVPDDLVTVPDVVLFPENVELGEPTEVVQPVVRDGMPNTEDRHQDREVGSTEGQVGIDMGREEQQLPRDNNEAIVVGAVRSGAPWFLTGWAEGGVEFMIDTGCQVTILVMSVFERMCASDPRIRSRLHPCGRRLISADSSSLMVRGELDMTVVFPGLSCNMVLVVASIGSEGLLGKEALQSCLLHRLDL